MSTAQATQAGESPLNTINPSTVTDAVVREAEQPDWLVAHIRNAPTRLMKDLGYGEGYVYAHDTADGIAEMSCLPDDLRTGAGRTHLATSARVAGAVAPVSPSRRAARSFSRNWVALTT